ncbi:transcription factor CP2-like isoform X1 [Hydractinia symbiolongicarpus]|uniref:transcription factor CP2-like isoform X1 n=1 Tax=Hydractinia symbiolongicarpus TaxID=13093 RepID=UPI0025511E3F|nr:transcription factor CP2-like isoform X1 [Hydractinia symbiolongicarpus]
MDEPDKLGVNTWRVDDLDGGLSIGLSNLHGLGTQELMEDHTPAYDMTQVLQLSIFKEEPLQSSLQSLNNSLEESLTNTSLNLSHMNDIPTFPGNFIMRRMDEKPPETNYSITLKAPTAPGRKLDEETLTWLNQGQSYEIALAGENETNLGTLIKSAVSIGFQERQHQYFEFEKYDEWVLNRPTEKMIELDVPMCLGVHNPVHVGTYTNEIEFQWDPSQGVCLYIKVNCLSSEFTKGKGESGVPLRLQIEIYNHEVSNKPCFVAGCQVKVFRAKGANRKLKLEKEKIESLSKEEAVQVQQSYDVTVFKKLDSSERLRRRSTETPTQSDITMSGIFPTQLSQLKIVNSCNSNLSLTPGYMTSMAAHTNLTANCGVEETQAWLRYNRFQNYQKCFANFTGADLLRLSRSDLIQLCGPADGIRLNNTLQARANRPLLTMYICPEWHENETGMREYHAMFLERLTVEDLKRKLAKKCGIEEHCITAILKQGPTGIHIHVDDEVVRNFVEEAHHVVEVLKDPITGQSKILLK